MEPESVRRRPSAIVPGRVSALVMATSISLQHSRSMDVPRFWWAAINKGSQSEERMVTAVDCPCAMWARGLGFVLGALKYQYGPSNGMTIGLARPIETSWTRGVGGTI